MTKIIDKYNRGVLGEGRNNGMAFGFLQDVGKGEYHTVQPPSPCKDYLAEVVFTEKHGIPTRAYGLTYKAKLDIFTDRAYMAIKMMKTHGGGGYSYSPSFEGDVKLLAKNYPEMERLLNDFEDHLGIKIKTKITPANDDFFLVEFSSDWCQSSHSISLYSLLLRVLMVATKKDKDIMSFLRSYSYSQFDVSLLNQCMAKIEAIYKEKKLPPNTVAYSRQKLSNYYQSPHNHGIVGWNQTFKEIQLGE